MKSKIVIFLALPFLAACADPIQFLKREIRKNGYILYPTPLESAGTGTLVGGKPKNLNIIAHPQTCFPDAIQGQLTNIRKVDKTALGNVSQKVDISVDLKFEFVKFMNTGNPMFEVGAGFDHVGGIEIQFGDANIEYLDSVLLKDFYENNMTDVCRDFLDAVGFVVQALRVDQLKFAFKEKAGGYMKLDISNIQQILDINVDVKFHIEQDYLLTFDSPKYIGYQLGRLKFEDRGMVLYRASSVSAGKYIFRTMRLFDPTEPLFAPMQVDLPEVLRVDNNGIYKN